MPSQTSKVSTTAVTATAADSASSRVESLIFNHHTRMSSQTTESHVRPRSDSSLSSPASSRPVTPPTIGSPISIPTSFATFSIVGASPVPTPGSQPPSTSGHFADIQETERSSSGDLPRSVLGSRSMSQIRDSFMPPPSRDISAYQAITASLPLAKLTKRLPSTLLNGEIEKPWLEENNSHGLIAYWLTYAVASLGIIASVLRCYYGWKTVPRIGNLCLVMEDDFDTLNTDIWSHEVSMGGFGNGEFEMTTNSPTNSFVRNGQLYIMPTLTSDVIGYNEIFNGHTYNLTGCTDEIAANCGAVSNSSTGTVINPVQSARLTTRYSYNIQFGKVEIRAKIPRGDWLWPALWMMPVNDTYGPWPASGELDIMESRGNGITYPMQGRNVVRGSLNWGPFTTLNRVYKTYGTWNLRRASYDQGFHTYTVEWDQDFIRIYVDTRLHYTLTLNMGESFWQRGQFPQVYQNGSQNIALQNPWINGTEAAPFDKPFFLIMNVAVGGTNGWFPDGAGNKPWLDNSLSAMYDFALKQSEWFATWPQGDDRAMIVDSVKMWQKC